MNINFYIENATVAEVAQVMGALAGFAGANVRGSTTAAEAAQLDKAEAPATDSPDPVEHYDVADAVVDFINDDPRFRMRTREAIVKHFGPGLTQETHDAIDNLVDDGRLETHRRRSDGATLYSLA